MKKKIIFILMFIINTFSIHSREVTPYDDLQIIGNYISTYYGRYKVLPRNFSELEKMPYFTEDDIKKRISGIKRNYNLDLKIIGSNEIRICMKKNEEIYEMKIFFGVIQEYNIFKNDKFVYNYQKDSNGNLILSDDNYEIKTSID
ncbi:MAG: hypothetical protein MJ160_00035 [Treponema sp.]|nr:hypothetical protein [Treponema sp.]